MAKLDKPKIILALETHHQVFARCEILDNIMVCRRFERGMLLNEQDRFYGFQVRTGRPPIQAVWIGEIK